ncbi:helix-turn-helix transcriptional regulator [Lacrimispora sp.]|uniref:helix-turn-helix domain-containing protein n=1 Tax=Lacrimispora sp. TaxID=2719234 RepID=UPI0032E457D0
MEFGEKLQLLRKLNNLTQEQLAAQLYVSRTAVSKWESGKGYPNIDSLKCISKLFGVSIDELLMGEELITLAEDENRRNLGQIFNLAYGIFDFIAVSFLVLPLFTQETGGHFLSVPFFKFTDNPIWGVLLSSGFILCMTLIGVIELLVQRKDHLRKRMNQFSLLVHSMAVLFFIAFRQLYVAAFLFLFLMGKVVLLIKSPTR